MSPSGSMWSLEMHVFLKTLSYHVSKKLLVDFRRRHLYTLRQIQEFQKGEDRKKEKTQANGSMSVTSFLGECCAFAVQLEGFH